MKLSKEFCLALVLLHFLTILTVVAHPAWGIVIDSQKRIIFSDVGQNAIWRIETDGRLTQLARQLHSHDLWQDPLTDALYGEHVYWIEAENRFESYFWQLLPSGEITRIAEIPKNTKPHTNQSGVYIYSEKGRLFERTVNGDNIIGGDPFAGLTRKPDSIKGFAVSSNKEIYVADSEYKTVWKIVPGGDPEIFYRSGFLWTPIGVAVESDSIYVLEDRPNGFLLLLSVWASPRVIRLRGGAVELLMAIDFNRHYVVIGGVLILLIGLGGIWFWKSKRRPRLSNRTSL